MVLSSNQSGFGEGTYEYDFFISHASEDKEAFVNELAKALEVSGAKVWYDDFVLQVGDSIRAEIDNGLSRSRAGIVVLSKAFFEKNWTRVELDGLATLRNANRIRLLPVRHGVTPREVQVFSPSLAGIVSPSSDDNLVGEIAEQLIAALNPTSVRSTSAPGANLSAFAEDSRQRWVKLLKEVPLRSPARLANGHYELTFGMIPTPTPVSLTEIRRRIKDAGRKKMTGWPPFLELSPEEWRATPVDAYIETWLGRPQTTGDARVDVRPDLSDYWRASQDGMLHTIRGYVEDRHDQRAGVSIDVAIPIWRVAEALEFVRRYSALFEGVEDIAVEMRFIGLDGRELSYDNWQYWIDDGWVSRSDEFTASNVVSVNQIDKSLPEIVTVLLAPLYEQFNFYELSPILVDNEISRLRSEARRITN